MSDDLRVIVQVASWFVVWAMTCLACYRIGWFRGQIKALDDQTKVLGDQAERLKESTTRLLKDAADAAACEKELLRREKEQWEQDKIKLGIKR